MFASPEKPLVTICIPVFNDCGKIKRCVESALSQTYENLEVVVSDNASTDGTKDLLRAYDNKAKIIYNEVNRGMMWNWRKTFIEAKGDYIVFLGSDDYMDKDYISDLMSHWTGDEDFISGCVGYVRDSRIDEYVMDPTKWSSCDDRELFSALRGNEKINLCVYGVYKKELWRKMLPKKLNRVRHTSIDRIMVFTAIVIAGGNYKLVSSAPYYKDRSLRSGYKNFREEIQQLGKINKAFAIFKKGLCQIIRDINIYPAMVSSALFFKTVVMLEGISLRRRTAMLGELLKWLVSRYKLFSLWSVWRIRISNYMAVHRKLFN